MKKAYILIIGLALVSPEMTQASGSRGGGGSSSGGTSGGYSRGGGSSQRDQIDQEKYRLGQSVFSGKAKLPSEILSRDLYVRQGRRLIDLQKKIAKHSSQSEAKKMDAKYLAGRLSAKQFTALKYFVKIRYTKKRDR